MPFLTLNFDLDRSTLNSEISGKVGFVFCQTITATRSGLRTGKRAVHVYSPVVPGVSR